MAGRVDSAGPVRILQPASKRHDFHVDCTILYFLFQSFIGWCGLSHLFSGMLFWSDHSTGYAVTFLIVKIITAAVSALTAVVLPALLLSTLTRVKAVRNVPQCTHSVSSSLDIAPNTQPESPALCRQTKSVAALSRPFIEHGIGIAKSSNIKLLQSLQRRSSMP